MVRSLLGGFLLAGLVFGIKEWRYYQWSVDDGKIFADTGIIVDISSQGKYVFAYRGAEYLLYSQKQYSIGDQLWLVGNLQTNSKPFWFSYGNISSWTFAIPIFSWAFDYAKRLKMKWWKGTIYETNSIQLKAWSLKLEAVWIVQSMKKWIQEKTIEAYGENKISGLILWMLIGDKSQIPENDYQQFINSGLVHLIAVSGGNILMIVVFLQCVLFFLPFYVRIGLILLTIVGYSLICGLDSSVFRAMLMGGLSMVALFRGREINIRRLISISVIIMLIINPYFLAYDTGFLLSYSALIGIVYFDTINRDKGQGIRDKENKMRKWLQYVYKTYISPSIWASIGIFPIIIFFMGQINLVSILGNLLVLPIVPFVMIYGFISVWLYSRLGWWWLLWIEQFLVKYIYKISELLANYWIFLQVSWLRVKYLVFLGFLVFFVVWRLKAKREVDWVKIQEKG